MSELRGVLTFHSETGTEGGYWAFQDERFMGVPDDTETCDECGYAREYIEEEAAAGRLVKVPGYPACAFGEHRWTRMFPDGRWSYEGLHVLEDGDRLTIFDKDEPGQVIWSGTIDLIPHPLFTKTVAGMWIHADQRGQDRETWARLFFEEHPAVLVRDDP